MIRDAAERRGPEEVRTNDPFVVWRLYWESTASRSDTGRFLCRVALEGQFGTMKGVLPKRYCTKSPASLINADSCRDTRVSPKITMMACQKYIDVQIRRRHT